MSSAEIGGDSSVQWTIIADKIRQTTPPEHAAHGNGGWRHFGIDDAGTRADGFSIRLKMPRAQADRDAFVDSLIKACADAQALKTDGSQQPVFLTLPIESGSVDQITIKWH